VIVSCITHGLYHELHTLKQGKLCKPRMAVIESSSGCNQSCNYCFFRDRHDDGGLSVQSMIDILDQLYDYGVRAVEWGGSGEPLVNSGIMKAIEHGAKIGMRQGMLTNGILFRDSMLEQFLRAGTYVRFNLDTVDRELYTKIHGKDDLEMVLGNFEEAIRYKKKYRYNCQISIKIGLFDGVTYDLIEDVVKYLAGKPFYSLQVKNLWNETGRYYNETITKQELSKRIHFNGTKLFKKIRYRTPMREQCWVTPVQTYIRANGDVMLCPYWMYRDKNHRIGNIFEKPFRHIWGGAEHRDKIAKIKTYECMKHDCRYMAIMRSARYYFKMGEWCFS